MCVCVCVCVLYIYIIYFIYIYIYIYYIIYIYIYYVYITHTHTHTHTHTVCDQCFLLFTASHAPRLPIVDRMVTLCSKVTCVVKWLKVLLSCTELPIVDRMVTNSQKFKKAPQHAHNTHLQTCTGYSQNTKKTHLQTTKNVFTTIHRIPTKTCFHTHGVPTYVVTHQHTYLHTNIRIYTLTQLLSIVNLLGRRLLRTCTSSV